ncbi:hypothetical protein [Phocaeicola sp.]|uniref:hypothetical protein n=1 Tax=Phocaeicola sp. TaxID=2773926 RepID=UPI0023CAA832|nr:hypothetical protein [Phocaeicola sp.]MDE5678594.1 hypothetical protein [Phocaeicola sp.]
MKIRICEVLFYAIITYCFLGLLVFFSFLPLMFLQGLKLCCFILVAALLIYYYKKQTFTALNKIVYLFLLYGIFIVIRGNWNVDFLRILNKFSWEHGVFNFILPMLALLPYYKGIVKSLFSCITIWMLLAVVSFVLFINNVFTERDGIEYLAAYGGMFVSGYLLIFERYLSKKQKLLCFMVYFMALFSALFMARRALVMSFIMYGLVFILNRLLVIKSLGMKFVFGIVLSVIVVFSVWGAYKNHLLDNIMDRSIEDTRSVVNMALINEISQKKSYICFGKGMDGTYYFPLKDEYGHIEDDRKGIETCYLNFVLTGGVVYLLLVIIVLLMSIVRGLRCRKLSIQHSSALYLMTYWIDLYTTSCLSFVNVRSVLFWISVGICMSKKNKYEDTL